MNKNEPLRYVIRARDLTVLARCRSEDIAGRLVEALIRVFSELWIDIEESPRGGDRASYYVTADVLFRMPIMVRCSAAEAGARFGQIDLQDHCIPHGF